MHLNRSSTRKILYSEPATDRSKAHSVSSYEPINSFTYEIVIKTNQSSVPQIQIVKGSKLSVTKQTDFANSMRLILALQKRRAKLIKLGFKQIQSNNNKNKRQIMCVNKVDKVVRNKRINLLRIFFIQLPNIKRRFQRKLTSCKFLYFSINNLLRKIKMIGLDAMKSTYRRNAKNINQNKQIRSTAITPQKINPSKLPMQNQEKSFSKNFTGFCKSLSKLNLGKDRNVFLKNLRAAVSQQQILLDSKNKNNQKEQNLLSIIYLIKILIKQSQSSISKQQNVDEFKKGTQRRLKTQIEVENKTSKQHNSNSNQSVLKIIKTFNQCLLQDSYTKWQKFVKSRESDIQAKPIIAELQGLNDILNNKIQSAIAQKTKKEGGDLTRLRRQIEQLKSTLQKKQKIIKQFGIKNQGSIQKTASIIQSVPSPVINEEDERISKKQYNEVLNANVKMNQRITLSNKKIDQLFKNVEDKNKLIQQAKIPVEQIYNKFCKINEEETVLLRKIGILQDTIDNLKSTIRIGNEKDQKIERLRNEIRDKNFMISGLQWQLQFCRNPTIDTKLAKINQQVAHNQSQTTAAEVPEIAQIKQDNERLKQLNKTLEQQCKVLREENERMYSQIRVLKTKMQIKQQLQVKRVSLPEAKSSPVKNEQASLSNVTSLQNVVVLLSNMLSFMMRISPKFTGVNNEEAVKQIFDKLTQLRVSNPENDQIFLQNCEKYVVSFIKACIN